ncbi:MAG: 12-oxophytodienoate reductase [Gammaproteobacteria bacterium]|nr:12-oxophytodienoate reductase [Gammaproteobacteria bacterium]|tara:strand:- start:1116 stop:2243 length:1128 start_codon:yes stop_codon:yes gene_type:complete
MADISILFKPLEMEKISITNRIVMAPMARNYSPDYAPDKNVAEYYARRASGGAGLIISEANFIDHPVANGYKKQPAIHGQKPLEGHKEVTRMVHEENGKIFCQLWHMGAERPVGGIPNPDLPALSASGYRDVESINGRALELEEIPEVQASYARAAANAKEVGYDGVEIHGAHGYLIDGFLWEVTNRRTDAYGGTFEKQLRFAIETIEQVRDAVGADFPISFRTSQWKSLDFNAKTYKTPQELEIALNAFIDAGVDIIHTSTRRFWEPEFEGSNLNLAGWAKKLTGIPSISVGSVGLAGDSQKKQSRKNKGLASMAGSQATNNLEEVIERMEQGEFDMIAVGRALLSNWDWPNMVREGRLHQARPFEGEHLKVLY